MNANLEVNQFVDTNILVYAYDRSAGTKHAIAVKLVEQCWEQGTGRLSLQVLQEFYVSVTRKISRPLDPATARQITADLANWRHHAPGANDFLQAIDIQQEYQLSFWDAFIVQSAQRLGCKYLLSEDLGHGQIYSDVQIVNPFLKAR